MHENYSSRRIFNDIALIRLSRPVYLNPGVGVICLPDVNPFVEPIDENLDGKFAIVMGWGRTDFSNDGQLQVSFTILNHISLFPGIYQHGKFTM